MEMGVARAIKRSQVEIGESGRHKQDDEEALSTRDKASLEGEQTDVSARPSATEMAVHQR